MFELAGMAFFVVLGKDSKLRAFHNICRHRAYTVVRKTTGTSNQLHCKYHGWSYSTEGKLVKAPKFEEMPGFRFEDNGLFEVKLISTAEGLLFVNFDSGTRDIPFVGFKLSIPTRDLHSTVTSVSVDTTLNWKVIGKL